MNENSSLDTELENTVRKFGNICLTLYLPEVIDM